MLTSFFLRMRRRRFVAPSAKTEQRSVFAPRMRPRLRLPQSDRRRYNPRILSAAGLDMRFPGFRRRCSGLEVGTLELDVMNRLWADGELDARGVLARLTRRTITLSTVQATLERLHRKGLVTRTKVGRAYSYRAAVTRERLIALLIEDLAERIADGELEPVISGFVELIGETDPALLGALEHRVKRRRERE